MSDQTLSEFLVTPQELNVLMVAALYGIAASVAHHQRSFAERDRALARLRKVMGEGGAALCAKAGGLAGTLMAEADMIEKGERRHDS